MTQPAFATCDFCDPHRDGVPPGFAVLPPVFRNYASSAPFSGQVVTVQCFEDNTTVNRIWLNFEQDYFRRSRVYRMPV